MEANTFMTKKEIYKQIVRLTSKIEQTKIAERIFNAVANKDAEKVDTIVEAFPEYYPELYSEIVTFGKKYKKLVKDSEEDNEKFRKVLEKCEGTMYSLAQTKIIMQIAEAEETGDAEKIAGVIKEFKEKYPYFVENLLNFQKEYTEFREEYSRIGNEGTIFGKENDEENGVYVFNADIIDALSFYILIILTGISELNFFYDEEIEDDEEVYNILMDNDFLNAIQNKTNEAFAIFVASYNIADWIGKDEETVGELLVEAFFDEFEETVEEPVVEEATEAPVEEEVKEEAGE